MKKHFITKVLFSSMLCMVIAVGCRKDESVRPIVPVTPPDTDTVLPPEEPLTATFSISDSQQVRFSPGNLQYVSGRWRFAAHQEDFLEENDENAMDLFGWSTSSNNWGRTFETNQQLFTGSFADWGTNPELVISLGAGWRTLSKDEWNYLLYKRVVNNGTGVGHSYLLCVLKGQYGLLLFPDNYKEQERNFESVPDSCIFLPAVGSRYGREINRFENASGLYWTSTVENQIEWYADLLEFHNMTINFGMGSRVSGMAVRLARNVR